MQSNPIKYTRSPLCLVFFQVAVLLAYLNANIVNVGQMGTAKPLLVAYVGISVLLFLTLWMKKRLFVRPHFFLFLLLMCWVAFRIIVDLGDMEYLKQITIATTGGMVLFYFLGVFLGISYQDIVLQGDKVWINKLVQLLFLFLLFWMIYNFSQRLRPSLFYLTDVGGSYQRSGNFLSISFIMVSLSYFIYSLKRIGCKASRIGGYFWLIIYTLSTLIALVGSQLFGSNSATAVILGVYLITLVMALLVPRKALWLGYLNRRLALPWSKKLLTRLFFFAMIGFFTFFALLLLVISITGFDITSLRLLGFGSGSNTSLLSRYEMFVEVGVNQMAYAPFFGNINVAYLTTGNAGKTLHSFFPYVFANLGLFGLIIVLALFASVFFQLYKQSKIGNKSSFLNYKYNMLALYSLFILGYLLLFANVATGVSWAVLWFTLGLISKPLGFKFNEKNC